MPYGLYVYVFHNYSLKPYNVGSGAQKEILVGRRQKCSSLLEKLSL